MLNAALILIPQGLLNSKEVSVKNRIIFRALATVALAATPLSAGMAQMWVPGSEIAGQSIQAETNGVTNTIYFDQGGAARIMSPGGMVIPATWTASGNQLCMSTATNRDCWNYAAPFQSGQPVTMVSQCQVASRWTALGTNMMAPPPPPPPMQAPMGERG